MGLLFRLPPLIESCCPVLPSVSLCSLAGPQTYGVSHVPDVMSLDLQQLFHREQGGDVPDQMVIQ